MDSIHDITNIYEFKGRLFVLAYPMVYFSDNYGETWKKYLFDDNIKTRYSGGDHFYLCQDRYLYFITRNAIYKSKTQSSVDVASTDLSEISSISIAPNPSSENFNCSIFSDNEAFYTFGLYDINGNLVKDFGQRFLIKGKNKINFEIPEVSKACYFVRMTKNGMSKSTMLIVK